MNLRPPLPSLCLLAALVVVVAAIAASPARAHPVVDNALDVVIHPDRVAVTARVADEQVRLVEGERAGPQRYRAHAAYVLRNLRIDADGESLTGTGSLESAPAGAPATAPAPAPAATHPSHATTAPAATPMPTVFAVYRLEYPLRKPPAVVRLGQDFLQEFPDWTATFAVKIRQSDQPAWQTGLLTRFRSAEFGCEWPRDAAGGVVATTAPAVETTAVDVPPGRTFREYAAHGVMHILTGYDHLLFVAALVLAAASLWDLVKIVTAFTVAHTLTLALSVPGWVTLPDRVVEPVIAASIVVVAAQNVLRPRSTRGWARLATAFAFGLFHGLGYAGGMRDAMADLPAAAFGAALAGFGVGVELGHQVVVIPLFALLVAVRRWGSDALAAARRYGSAAISVAGVVFLVKVVSEFY